jgi:hypothetical protein
MESRAGIYSLFRNSDRLASTSSLVRRSQYNLARTFHRRTIPLAENRFLQAGNGAEKYKGKNPGHALHLVKTSRYEN